MRVLNKLIKMHSAGNTRINHSTGTITLKEIKYSAYK